MKKSLYIFIKYKQKNIQKTNKNKLIDQCKYSGTEKLKELNITQSDLKLEKKQLKLKNKNENQKNNQNNRKNKINTHMMYIFYLFF